MSPMNDIVSRLADELVKLPGIGPRAAGRLAEFLLRHRSLSSTIVSTLSTSLERVTSCSLCNRLMVGSQNERCDICSTMQRDHSLLMIVAKDTDVRSIERFGLFKGVYYVLGGYIPLTVKEVADHHFIKHLVASIAVRAKDPSLTVSRTIIALNATTEGEHTLHAVREAIANTAATIEITTLGRGLSTGSELEYVDNATFKAALESSRKM